MSRTLQQLVERHTRRWEQESRSPAPRPAGLCIALSRQPYSGVEELAERLVKELDYELFGIELVDYIAREQRVQRQLVAALDERMRSAVERWVIDAFHTNRFRESDYLRAVVRAVSALGERGRAVIVGRGAPYILGPERALRVLVVAPREQRAQRLAQMRHIPPEEAAQRLAEEDTARHRFLGQFRVNPDDPTLYDVVVNTAVLRIDGAVGVVLRALEQRRRITG
jgi:cytidylate kinase